MTRAPPYSMGHSTPLDIEMRQLYGRLQRPLSRSRLGPEDDGELPVHLNLDRMTPVHLAHAYVRRNVGYFPGALEPVRLLALDRRTIVLRVEARMEQVFNPRDGWLQLVVGLKVYEGMPEHIFGGQQDLIAQVFFARSGFGVNQSVTRHGEQISLRYSWPDGGDTRQGIGRPLMLANNEVRVGWAGTDAGSRGGAGGARVWIEYVQALPEPLVGVGLDGLDEKPVVEVASPTGLG